MDTLADASGWLWLQNSAIPTVIRQAIWLYPLIETLHILSLALLFGSIAMFDLRLLGVSRHLLVTDMARHLLPWAYMSFAVVVATGFLLFAVDATQLVSNPAFRLKLLLIAATGINAVFFHSVPFRSVQRWNRGATPVIVQTIAILSLVLWTSVIVCGRLIAYV